MLQLRPLLSVPFDGSAKLLRPVRSIAIYGISVAFVCGSSAFAAAEDEISFPATALRDRSSSVSYNVEISGQISTPNSNGVQRFPLISNGEFRFSQKQFASTEPGPFSLRAIRQFEVAETNTVVGDDHKTSVTLPMFFRTIHVWGSDSGMLQLCPRYSLPRKQVDLLQMPFDVLPAHALLTSSKVKKGDKWNAAGWVTPMLIGVDAVIEQSVTCRLVSFTKTEAIIAFSGNVNGAVQGSATEVSFDGTLKLDRTAGFIKSLSVTQNEKRSPGPVSPGLDVVAKISWTQIVASDLPTPAASLAEVPSEQSLQLLLQTPLKLQLLHSREWHLFHETPSVLMMRQLKDGNLISQCNISTAVTVPPGEHTPDSEFLADVEQSVSERKGRVTGEDIVRDDGRWRIRRVQAIGDAAGEPIQWDYFLCAAATGEQFSIVFSYSQADSEVFGDEAKQLLGTLKIAGKRPVLPYR